MVTASPTEARLIVLVFTDIVRSTEISSMLSNRDYQTTILYPHRERVKRARITHHGRVVETPGDGFLLAFDNPINAVQFAVAIQSSHITNPIATPLGTPLSMRIGMHIGAPTPRGSEYDGFEVAYAARVAGLPGLGARQIFLSQAIANLLRPVDIGNSIIKPLERPHDLEGIGTEPIFELQYRVSEPETRPILPNPFFPNRPVPFEHFIGRKDLIYNAFSQIQKRSHLSVWGGHGMGKTSFLNYLATPQAWRDRGIDPSQAIIVTLSCRNIFPFNTSNFVRSILKSIQKQSEQDFPLHTVVTTLLEQPINSIGQLDEVLRPIIYNHQFLLLLIDDYENALLCSYQYTDNDISNFVAQVRSFCTKEENILFVSMIVTSSRPLSEIGPSLKIHGSPWFNHYLFRSLPSFSSEERSRLLDNLPIETEWKTRIERIAGGHPALLQKVGYQLYQSLDLELFCENFPDDALPFFQANWQLATEIEQNLLILLVLINLPHRLGRSLYDLGHIAIAFSQREIILTGLVQRGILTPIIPEAGSHISYRFSSSLMEWWILQELLKTIHEPNFATRLMSFVPIIGTEQMERVRLAFTWIASHPDHIPRFRDFLES
jgi:class 3 adenylate cyclase